MRSTAVRGAHLRRSTVPVSSFCTCAIGHWKATVVLSEVRRVALKVPQDFPQCPLRRLGFSQGH